MELQTMTVKTPRGDMLIEEKGDFDNYPGIFVSIDGEQIATIDIDSDTGQVVIYPFRPADNGSAPVCEVEVY